MPETLRPVSGGSATNLNSNAYDASLIDDPTSGAGPYPSDWLVGSDPSGTPGSNGPEYVDGPASATAWTGGTGATWGTYANVIDASDTTLSTVTLGSTNTDYQNYFSFAAADWSDIPADAVITGISVVLRHTIGTANRVQQHIALATANGTLLGSEVNVANNTQGSTSTLGATTNTEKTVDNFGALPSRAELISGTFGVRLRQRRSNTSTISIYSIKATVSYVTPQTVNTEVRAPLSDPTQTLAGSGNATLRARVGKLGSGSNPTARVELRNAAGTLIATPVANTTVSAASSGGGAELSGTVAIGTIAPATDIVAWVVGTGAAGGLVEVDSIELEVPTQVAQNFPQSVTVGVSVTRTLGKSAAKSLARPVSAARTIAKAGAKILGRSVTGTPTLATMKGKLQAITVGVSVARALTKRPAKTFARPVAVTPALASVKALFRTISRGVTVGPTLRRAVGRNLARVITTTTLISASRTRFAEIAVAVGVQILSHRAVSRALSRSVASARTIRRDAGKTLQKAVSRVIEIVPLLPGKFFEDVTVAVSTTRSIGRAVAARLHAGVNVSPVFRKALTHSLTRAVTAAIDIATSQTFIVFHTIGVSVATTFEPAVAVAKGILFGTSGIVDLARAAGKRIPVPVGAAPLVQKAVGVALGFTIGTVINILRRMGGLISGPPASATIYVRPKPSATITQKTKAAAAITQKPKPYATWEV